MKKKILFDATLIANAGIKNSDRSGIFFAAYNILIELLKRPELEISLYCNPSTIIALRSVLRRPPLRDYTLKIINDSDAWRMGGWRDNITERKMAAHGNYKRILKLLSLFFKVFLIFRLKFYCSKQLSTNIHGFDAYFSPAHKIPVSVRTASIPHYTLIYDAIPLLFPDFSPFIKWGYSWQAELLKSLDESDHCFAISEQTKKDFLKFAIRLKAEQVTVTHLAAAAHFYDCQDQPTIEKIRTKYNIPAGVKYVFSLCTLEPRKNLIFSVKNFIEFIRKNKVDDIVFVLGGGYWDGFRRKLEETVGDIDDYKDKIIRIGYVDDEDLAALYSGALCTIYASLYEGFGKDDERLSAKALSGA